MDCVYYDTLSRDEKTGYTQFRVKPLEDCPGIMNGLVYCSGIIPKYAYGTPLSIEGDLVNKTIKVSNITISSSAIKYGLTYILEKLTAKREEKLIELAKGDLFNLLTVPFTDILNVLKNRDAAEKLYTTLRKWKEQEEIYRLLLKYSVDVNVIESLEDMTINQLMSNLYLSLLFAGGDIHLIDQIAYNELNVKAYNSKRIRGFFYATMMAVEENGDTCISLDEFYNKVNNLFKSSIYTDVTLCKQEIKYYIEEYPDFELRDDYVYLKNTYNAENKVIHHIKRLQKTKEIYDIDLPDIPTQYNKEQKEAFNLLKSSGIKVLTGPPGSGKTFLLKGIINAYKQTHPNDTILLSATTGKAAKVMTESIGIESKTCHKMLDIRPYQEKRTSLDGNLIIVDEVSMMGIKLAMYLFQAINNGSTVILVGDEDQLQSVDCGNILHDIILSQQVEVYRLKQVMRQGGTIYKNAVNIKNKLPLEIGKDFQIEVFDDEQALLNKVLQEHAESVQVLSPIKGEDLGVYNLNNHIQPKHQGISVKYGNITYYVGDKVIFTKTDYESGYINGDIGVIEKIEEDLILVNVDDTIVPVRKNCIKDMNLAYCVTVHKSQGSEYDYIQMIVPMKMLNKRIIYTGITRAKKGIKLYVYQNALEKALNNDFERERITLLKNLL